MSRPAIVLSVALAVVVPVHGQVIYDGTPALVWFSGTTCPARWTPLAPNQTRPAGPDTYTLRRPDGGPRIVLSLAALQNAWTVNGVLQQTALTAALASGAVVSRREGQSAQVRCTWRPIGGQP